MPQITQYGNAKMPQKSTESATYRNDFKDKTKRKLRKNGKKTAFITLL